MDLLDVIIVLVALASALHGLRVGAAIQILSFAGSILGLGVGIVLVSALSPHVQSGDTRTFVALLLLLMPCGLFWAVGRQLGAHLSGRMRAHPVRHVDAAGGALIAAAGTLVFSWILASLLVSSPVPAIASQIQGSAILRGVTNVLPPLPTELASLANKLSADGFPVPVIDFEGPLPPVKLPASGAVREAVMRAGPSTVKVIAYGCDNGELVENGSGFVVDGDYVVTNAHVVAGSDKVVVADEVADHDATPIYVNPRFDLAVLKVPGLSDPSLSLDPDPVGRATKAVVLGYPGGGPFNAQPAGVLARLDARGFDIYNEAETTRWVYELQSLVRPGNSGGPLVEPDGLVVGVVFSRSASNDDIGFALASPGVLRRLDGAVHSPQRAVSTGRCIDTGQ